MNPEEVVVADLTKFEPGGYFDLAKKLPLCGKYDPGQLRPRYRVVLSQPHATVWTDLEVTEAAISSQRSALSSQLLAYPFLLMPSACCLFTSYFFLLTFFFSPLPFYFCLLPISF